MIAEQKMPSSLLDSLADQSILYIETEWTLRLKALQQIQDFLLKEDTTLPIFLDTYKNITVNLQVQLKDLRSAIVKEAIKIITIASAKFRTLFDNIVSKFIDIFFTLVTSTTNAISKSAYEGLKSIIEHIYSPKVLLKILENSKQKSLQVKAISSECLLFTLQAFPKSIIDFVEIEQIIVAIKNFVCESGRIREIGKECFIAFTDKYPEKCDEVIQSIPPNSRKLIEELKALKKTFAIDNTAEFPMNIEISDEEWRIFEKLDVFEAVRLAVTNLSFQSSNEIQLEILMEKVDHSVNFI